MSNPMCLNGPPKTHDDYVHVLLHMNTKSIILGIFLVVGSIASTIPQHAKIWKTKSSVGLSYLWLFLANVNQFSAILTAVITKFPQVQACDHVGIGSCLPSMLDVFQLVSIWVFTFPIYIWYLKFANPSTISKKDWLWARILFVAALAYMVITTLLAAVFIHKIGECEKLTLWYAQSLGIFSTVITFVQYVPQIYATFKTKSSGSFSILMLLMQAPGSTIIVIFLVFISHDEVFVWLSYVSAIIQQVILLCLLIYYDRKAKGQKKSTNIQGDEVESEHLLASIVE